MHYGFLDHRDIAEILLKVLTLSVPGRHFCRLRVDYQSDIFVVWGLTARRHICRLIDYFSYSRFSTKSIILYLCNNCVGFFSTMYDVLRLRYNDVTLKVTSKVHKRSKKMNESSGELSDVSDQMSDITEIISDVGTDESDVDAEEDIQPTSGRNDNP